MLKLVLAETILSSQRTTILISFSLYVELCYNIKIQPTHSVYISKMFILYL